MNTSWQDLRIEELSGEVIERGVPCVRFRTEAGKAISLEGVSPQVFQEGLKFRVRGAFVEISRCMQGPAFRVDDWEAIE